MRIDRGWLDRSNNEMGFRVDRSVNGSSLVTIATLPGNATVYLDVDVVPGARYQYRVMAFNEHGGVYSNTANAPTKK